MKAVIFMAIFSFATCAPSLRDKRSHGHYGSLYSDPEVYTVQQPSYSAPVYYTLGNREVHTTSATRYTVRVPVIYDYHIEEPVRHSTVYSAPRTVYSAPRVVYSSPTWYDAGREHAYEYDTVESLADPWC